MTMAKTTIMMAWCKIGAENDDGGDDDDHSYEDDD